MKYATDRPYADPEKAARRLPEICNTAETDVHQPAPVADTTAGAQHEPVAHKEKK